MFITFEGVDGSGKTTQAQKLYNYFKNNLQKKVILTKEPGGTDLANAVREILLDDKYKNMSILSEILLHFAARCDHIEKVILPKLNEGYIVISDRFYDSTIAYQAFARKYNLDFILNLKQQLITINPDITFFIDLQIELIQKRIANRNKENNINCNHYDRQKDDFHQKVREGFLFLYKNNPNRIKYIKGDQEIEKIFSNILEEFKSLI